ncbi:MAG TPA: hypothetical protein VHX66_10060 [Solirubrobacteraceae bacterium]|nr:hypothetical protein [Solirubrobacteraceae bacterium]
MTRRPTPTMAVALAALFVALGGSAYAATRINGAAIKRNSLPADRIRHGSITAAQVNLAKLGTVANATHASTADNATHASSADNATHATTATTANTATTATTAKTATNATTFNSLSSAQFLRSDTCQVGGIRGYGHFTPAQMSSTALTANGTLGTLNCAGKAVLVHHLGAGRYVVQFAGYPGGYAICQIGPLGQSGGTTFAPPFVCTLDEFAPGEWEVGVYNLQGTAADSEFTLLLY